MDVFPELLTSSLLVRADKPAEDLKQKSKNRYKTMRKVYAAPVDDETITVGVSSFSWDEVERRSGEDRREQEKCRGKWLESRLEKDRRELSNAIFVKI